MTSRRVNVPVIIVLALILMVTALFLAWRRHITNYTDAKGQLRQGQYAKENTSFDGLLRVVTWNLHFGEHLDEVIATLKNATELHEADLLLLQEVNADEAETIASGLEYNYIFYPTVYSRQRQGEYGLAILSKWSLHDPEKMILPNWLPGWAENRYLIKAVTSINGQDIAIYNTHFDVAWMGHQGEFLGQQLEKPTTPIILGGDFNTWQPGSVAALESLLGSIKLERLTRGTGYTFESNVLRFTLDHIFSIEELDFRSGVVRNTRASDHSPVWAEIKLQVEK